MSDEVTPNQWRIFFASLEVAESVSNALRKSKIPRSTAYWQKRNVQWVSERWLEAIEAGNDYLKDAARERAVEGVTSTHVQYHRGEVVATHTETKYSDRLLLALLASRDPSFRQTSSDQVQQRLIQELTRVLDVLQKRLPPDVYEMVIEIISTSDTIDASPIGTETPRYLASGEENDTGISQ